MTPGGTAYSESGAGKPVLIFVHGVGMNRLIWQPQIEFFSNHYRVICYDMLGHGESPGIGTAPRLANYTAQLQEIFQARDISSAGIIGHSMGALVAMAFALESPGQTSCMVALNAVYSRTNELRRAVIDRADKVLDENRVGGIDSTLERWFGHNPDSDRLDKISTVRQFLNRADPQGYGRTYRLFAESDEVFAGRLGQLAMPVLYMTGSADPNSTPAMSRKMASETPCGVAKVIEDEAHMMAYISAKNVNPVIEEFLCTHLREPGV